MLFKEITKGEKTKMENEKTNNKTEEQPPKVCGEMELPKINFSDFNGVKAKVETVELVKGSYGWYYKVSTITLTTIGTGENTQNITGSTILGLFHDKEKNVYGWGKDSKTALFLKKYDAKTPEDLVDKEVLVTVEIKGDKQFLRIV